MCTYPQDMMLFAGLAHKRPAPALILDVDVKSLKPHRILGDLFLEVHG